MIEMHSEAPRRALNISPPDESAPIDVTDIDVSRDETDSGRRLVCAACGHPITTTAARIRLNDRDEWLRTNPGGWTYRFACFSTAPGCVPQGVPSKQATWFVGYHWYVQGCGSCARHLGWLFFRGDHEFFALVLDCLVEEASSSPAS